MSVKFNKNGIISTDNLYESNGANILLNSEKYTADSPCVLSGKISDTILITNMYAQVTPGETYYLLCKTDSTWGNQHGYTESNKGKVTIWIYANEAYNPSNTNFKTAINFHAATTSSLVGEGIWKWTAPSNINMARIRFNTYSNGTDIVTCKFWDTFLIPAKYYTKSNPQLSTIPSMKVGKDYIAATEIYEF